MQGTIESVGSNRLAALCIAQGEGRPFVAWPEDEFEWPAELIEKLPRVSWPQFDGWELDQVMPLDDGLSFVPQSGFGYVRTGSQIVVLHRRAVRAA